MQNYCHRLQQMPLRRHYLSLFATSRMHARFVHNLFFRVDKFLTRR